MLLLKTLWEKQKMLVTSIFSFTKNVFYSTKDEFHRLESIYFVVCKCYLFKPVWNFVVWQRTIPEIRFRENHQNNTVWLDGVIRFKSSPVLYPEYPYRLKNDTRRKIMNCVFVRTLIGPNQMYSVD